MLFIYADNLKHSPKLCDVMCGDVCPLLRMSRKAILCTAFCNCIKVYDDYMQKMVIISVNSQMFYPDKL